MVTGIFALVLLIGGIILLLLPNKEEKRNKEEIEERLRDETIYDPVSGVVTSLEDAEKGINIQENSKNRIKSSDELKQFYSEEEIEVEKITQIIKENGSGDITEVDFEFLTENIFEKAKILKNYEEIETFEPTVVNHNFFLGILLAKYSITTGKYIYTGNEYQIYGLCLQGNMISNNMMINPKKVVSLLSPFNLDFSFELIEGNIFFKASKPAKAHDFIGLLNEIRNFKDYRS